MIAASLINRSVAVEIPMIGPRLVDLRAEQAAERTGQALPEIERLPFDLSALEWRSARRSSSVSSVTRW